MGRASPGGFNQVAKRTANLPSQPFCTRTAVLAEGGAGLPVTLQRGLLPLPRFVPDPLFFHDEPVRCLVDLVGFRVIEQVKCVDLHVNEFLVIEGLGFLLAFLVPENDNAVLHLLTAGYVLHTVRSGMEGYEGYGTFQKKGIREKTGPRRGDDPVCLHGEKSCEQGAEIRGNLSGQIAEKREPYHTGL
jgi:hypothetical protein